MALTVQGPDDGEFRWSFVVDSPHDDPDLDATLRAALARHHEGTVQLWLQEVTDGPDAIAAGLGFGPYRDLWQLRCELPNVASGLDTRPLTDDDLDGIVDLNNRAFHWHPEQGGLTVRDLRRTMAEDWFEVDGFRVLEVDHELIGFCWTKIHPDTSPPLGEIYVIAIDPSHHGRGLGRPMTLAGLEWLTAAGLGVGMLYVESDNDAANATYAGIGFTRHHVDRAYRLDR